MVKLHTSAASNAKGGKLPESTQRCYYKQGFKVWTIDADKVEQKRRHEDSGASGSGL